MRSAITKLRNSQRLILPRAPCLPSILTRHNRAIFSSHQPRNPAPEPVSKTKNENLPCNMSDYYRLYNQRKWGFVIYRCDYRSDDAWENFIEGWRELTHHVLRNDRYDLEHLIPTLEFTVKEDRSALEGASVHHVRKLFTEWTKSEEAVAEYKYAIQVEMERYEQRRYPFLSYSGYYPRCWVCVHVDAEALDGCLRYLSSSEAERWDAEYGYLKGGGDPPPYVTLVEKEWEESSPRAEKEKEEYQEEEEEEEEKEEEEDEEENFWVKMDFHLVLPERYAELMGSGNSFQYWVKYCDHSGIYTGIL